MRETNISNVCITYPDELVWKNDACVIQLESGTAGVGARVYVEEPAGNNYTLEYHSDAHSLLFCLDDAIKALYSDNLGVWRCRVTVYHQGTPSSDFGFTFNVLNGKSFITRSHGTSSVMYIYNPDELRKVQVFSPQQGTASLDRLSFNVYSGLNQFDLTGAISDAGEYSLCLSDSNQVPPLVNVVTDEAVTPYKSIIQYQAITVAAQQTHGGDLFHPNKVIFPICHTIVYQNRCDDFNFGELSYTDLDGMSRYLGGRVTEDVDEVTSESYINSSPEVYKTNPNRFIIKHEKTVRLALTDIDKEAYPNDIMYSDSLCFRSWNGEWKSCSIKTKSLSREDDDFVDIELEIIVSQ